MNGALSETVAMSFREDAPRPPVPGQEGEVKCRKLPIQMNAQGVKKPVKATRRDEEGLGEPEGSASPDSPLARWTKSLHALLGNQDGTRLFRVFLEREQCADALDFWFACNGFRQMDLKDDKTLRVAKAIYKCYVEADGVVCRRLKPATKTFIRHSVKRHQIDSALFDQAQTEIQTSMKVNAYQTFLQSDIYLEYVRSGGENQPHTTHTSELARLKLLCGYLPTLNEEEEWSCNDFKAKALAVFGLSAKSLLSSPLKTVEMLEKSYRSTRRCDPAKPYQLASGSFAPTTSANDSEISSDATTDDSMSMTDSSVDGIPPYKCSKKQIQREMHRNMRMNGRISLPAFPRPQRSARDMTPVEPAVFAAQLISRLERLKQEQETIISLEERLQQIQDEEDHEEFEFSSSWQCRMSEDDPQIILDEHLSRVLRTPGCQLPRVACHSPGSCSPEPWSMTRPVCRTGYMSVYPYGKMFVSKHIHHHYIHHHSMPKSKEQLESEAAQRVQGMCTPISECCPSPYAVNHSLGPDHGSSIGEGNQGCLSTFSKHLCRAGEEVNSEIAESTSLQLPNDSSDRSHNVWQWIMESDRQARHRLHNTQSTRKLYGLESTYTHNWGSAGISGHLHTHQPAHPFIQDPAMPPLAPLNTLAQLEEACRRLEEVSKPPKQSSKEPKKSPCSHANETVVTYFFCGEEIPYRRMMKTHSITLGHFKEQLRKKGNYRYYFKKASEEFECGAVFEEVWGDSTVLPIYEGKILGKVERAD